MYFMKIAVSTKNAAFGVALSRGLAERFSHFQVSFTKDWILGDADIFVTDEIRPQQDCDIPEEKILYLNQRKYQFNGISDLGRQLMRQNSREQALLLSAASGDRSCVFGFFSLWGGSGTTSIAIETGRLLSLHYEKTVLYLSLAPKEDFPIYAEVDLSPVRSKRELIYRVEKDIVAPRHVYTASDRWGLLFIKDEVVRSSFLEMDEKSILEWIVKLKKSWQPDIILVDFGTHLWPKVYSGCMKLFHVVNAQDKRHIIQAVDSIQDRNIVKIFNRCIQSAVSDTEISIEEDTESFTEGKNSIMISPTKSFASGVRSVADLIDAIWGNHIGEIR